MIDIIKNDDGKAIGVKAKDNLTGEEIEIHAKVCFWKQKTIWDVFAIAPVVSDQSIWSIDFIVYHFCRWTIYRSTSQNWRTIM